MVVRFHFFNQVCGNPALEPLNKDVYKIPTSKNTIAGFNGTWNKVTTFREATS